MIPVSQPTIGPAEALAVQTCLLTNQLTMGPMVERFERELGEFLGVEHVVATCNGTTALHLALAALGLQAGDQVLVPDLTFVATANAVAYTGATPVLCDVDPWTWNIDLSKVDVNIWTRAIIPVHLYGVPANMATINAFAKVHDLAVIEDAAEGLGGYLFNKPLGTLSKAGTFSFYGNKVLTTGEGGAVVTHDSEYAGFLRHLRGQGQAIGRRYFHDMVGYNYRMTDLQAAIGVGQMSHLADMLESRRAIIDRYRERFLGQPGACTWQYDYGQAAPWLFTVYVGADVRDAMMHGMAARGIETRPTFVPLHRMPIYRARDEYFPMSSRIGDGGISLPTFPTLTLKQVDYICDVFLEELHLWRSTNPSSY